MTETTIPGAVARIHQIVESGVHLASPEKLSEMADAFNLVDHRACLQKDDALALLSLAKLILKDVVAGDAEIIETDGRAQLVMFAWAYLGRALEKLEMQGKEAAMASGTKEV